MQSTQAEGETALFSDLVLPRMNEKYCELFNRLDRAFCRISAGFRWSTAKRHRQKSFGKFEAPEYATILS